MPKISVIVPIHNNVNNLDRCLTSIVNQSYTDLEILLIDDGSTDDSFSICMKYAEKDSRIKVLHQNNQGVSAARNRGIDSATGEYLCFVDSDDYVVNDYCKNLLEMALKEKADMAVGFYNCTNFQDNKFYINMGIFPSDTAFNGLYTPVQWIEICLRYRESLELMPHTLWGKIFKRQLFNHVRLPINWKIGEDSAIVWQLCLKANYIAFRNIRDYVYTMANPNSLVKKNDGRTNNSKILQQQISLFNILDISNRGTVDEYRRIANSASVGRIISKYKD